MTRARSVPTQTEEVFDLRKKVLRLETLYDVSRTLAAAPEERALLDEVAARAVAVLDAAGGFAATFDDGAEGGAVAAIGLPAPSPTAAASDPFVLDLCRALTPLSRADETVLGSRAESVVGAPLVSDGRAAGVLVLLDREARGGKGEPFDEEDRRFLGSLAALASSALESR